MAPPKNNPALFWSWVDQPENPESCWFWQGNISHRGYGKVTWDSKSYPAHRVAAWLSGKLKSLLDSRLICHSCDIPLCCRPSHLFAGTHKDNAEDRVKKNRSNTAKGENAGQAKLSEIDVEYIRNNVGVRGMQRILAHKFGVSEATIHRIVKRMCWK